MKCRMLIMIWLIILGSAWLFYGIVPVAAYLISGVVFSAAMWFFWP